MQKLIDHAGLTKECVIVGASNRMEIWDKAEWDKYMLENEAMIAQLGEELDI
jgi:MraZ protein